MYCMCSHAPQQPACDGQNVVACRSLQSCMAPISSMRRCKHRQLAASGSCASHDRSVIPMQGCGSLQADLASRAMAALSHGAGQEPDELLMTPHAKLAYSSSSRRASAVPDIKLPRSGGLQSLMML